MSMTLIPPMLEDMGIPCLKAHIAPERKKFRVKLTAHLSPSRTPL
jgi:hypothetical protein